MNQSRLHTVVGSTLSSQLADGSDHMMSCDPRVVIETWIAWNSRCNY